MHVLIAGCGIAGLATGLALRRFGIDFTVIEQAPALGEVGAGIQLSPNAVRILFRLGLEAPLAACAVAPLGLDIRDHASGERILRTPLGETARRYFGAPYYHLHRADLLRVLVGALGLERVRLGARIAGFAQDSDGARLELEGGESLAGDLLIGADGIHSIVRAGLFGAGNPRFSGNTAWRGLIPAAAMAAFDPRPMTAVWWGPGRSVVHYYVRAGELINWIGIAPAGAGDVESWSATGSTADALAEFAGWHEEVLSMIGASEAVFKQALFDRDPLPAWARGRVVVIGDAAHSMMPYHGQGGGQSIEDGYVLADCLGAAADRRPGWLETALRRFQDRRIERANWVQRFSREAEALFHMRDPAARARRDRRLRENQARYANGFPPGQERIYGYDPDLAGDSVLAR